MKNKKSRLACLLLATVLTFGGLLIPHADAATVGEHKEVSDYMHLKNQAGPSGVALGATGSGYYEIDPTGTVTRMCINNIHKSFVDKPAGMMLGVYDGKKAVRLQRDNKSVFGMKGYADSIYTGLWPTVSLSFENAGNGVSDMGFSAYSGVIAQDVKNSSLPAVFYEVTLRNDSGTAKNMSAVLSWSDLIGRGLRDTESETPGSLDGESNSWHFMTPPATFARGITLSAGDVTYRGVTQYAKEQLLPWKATFQNYNNNFIVLAEDDNDSEVTILKQFRVSNTSALSCFVKTGELSDYDETETHLSAPGEGEADKVCNASAVAVKTEVPAGGSKTVRFLVSWFMPEITDTQMKGIHAMEGCDYNKYYHNYFASAEKLTEYAIGNRAAIRQGISDWQQPIFDSSLPEWLQFKLINSGYTLYTNGVLNKRGNFSSLEGEMGGYGGTMDQKMSSHPFYEKLFPELNLAENRQFANVTGKNGEIQHFDVHYYHGIADSDPNNRVNPTPAGSMTDNTGSWMVQMWNLYRQTGDSENIRHYFDVMKTGMAFIASKCAAGTYIPNYYTTYDDYQHPAIMIFSGTVYLNMLDIAAQWATLMEDVTLAAQYRAQAERTRADVELLYGNYSESSPYPDFYAFGSDNDFLTSNGKSGSALREVMFAGAMAGQFISRYSGLGDVIPYGHFVSHMSAFLASSVQKSSGYYAPKVFNVRTEQDMDNTGSRCWPFYLDSYGGMAAIQAGFVEDGLDILLHTLEVEKNLGYIWTQNLWNPGYSTYMTAPVSWFISDILAGSALDVPAHTLTLGPNCVAGDGVGFGNTLDVTLYYPKFWATVHYDPTDNAFTYRILRTFYEDGETPITFDTVIAAPAGTAAADAKTIRLPKAFIIEENAVLDLSAYLSSFCAVTQEKLLVPVDPYTPSATEKPANGSGLTETIYKGDSPEEAVDCRKVSGIDLRFNADAKPAPDISGEYLLVMQGRLLPRYGQTYQLILEYTGNQPTIILNGKEITGFGTSLENVISQQFTPTDGCKLMVIQTELKANTLVPIEITYEGDISDREDDVLRLLWWSSTQNMGLIAGERMYPLTYASDWIDGTDFNEATARIEGDHMAYTTKNSYAIYCNIDFGSHTTDSLTFRILVAAPDSSVSRGGTMEIRLGNTSGKLLGTLEFTPTGDWNAYKSFTCSIAAAELSGVCDICLVFHPVSDFLLNYTKFIFESSGPSGDPVSAFEWTDGKSFTEATAQVENDHMAWTKPDTYAIYRDLHFGDQKPINLTLQIEAGAPENDVSKGGVLEVRLGNTDGTLLGSADFTPTGDWAQYELFSVPLDGDLLPDGGVHTICLIFKPKSDYLLNYTRFRFTRDRAEINVSGITESDVTVQLFDSAGTELKKIITDDSGAYSFSVPSGTYRLRLERADGAFTVKDITVNTSDGDLTVHTDAFQPAQTADTEPQTEPEQNTVPTINNRALIITGIITLAAVTVGAFLLIFRKKKKV